VQLQSASLSSLLYASVAQETGLQCFIELYHCGATEFPVQLYHCGATEFPVELYHCGATEFPVELYHCGATEFPVELYHCGTTEFPVELYHCGTTEFPVELYHCGCHQVKPLNIHGSRALTCVDAARCQADVAPVCGTLPLQELAFSP
jgi:hypothetical protein